MNATQNEALENALLNEIEQTPDAELKTVYESKSSIPTELVQSLIAGQEGREGDADAEGSDVRRIAEDGSGDATTFSLSELLDAETAVALLGMVMTTLTVAANNFFPSLGLGSKKDIKRLMILDADERKILQKPMERLFKEQEVGFKSPWAAMLIAFIAVFGMKLFMAYTEGRESAPEADEAPRVTPRATTGKKRGRPRKNPLPAQNNPAQNNPAQVDLMMLPPSNFN